MLIHLPRMEGWGVEPRIKNGPALAGYGAEAMREALTTQMTTLPEQLRRSLTWESGKELAQHAQLKTDTGSDSRRQGVLLDDGGRVEGWLEAA